jgi:fucose 4-O-acetylase-like acetyltransferase
MIFLRLSRYEFSVAFLLSLLLHIYIYNIIFVLLCLFVTVKMAGERSPYLDNVKGVLIFLVMWYHSLVVWYAKELPLGVSGLESLLLLGVMPGFALVSGYLASPNLTVKRQNTLVTTLAVFVIFQIINWLMDMLNGAVFAAVQTKGATNSSSKKLIEYPIPLFFPTVMDKVPDTPGGLPVTWYLLAYMFWRVLTPLVDRLRWPVATSVCVGTVALTIDLGFGSQNIVSFFPFYVSGYVMRRGQVRLWGRLTKSARLEQLGNLFFVLFPTAFVLLSAIFPAWWGSTVGFVVGHAYGCLYGLAAPGVPLCTSLASFGTRLAFYALALPAIFSILRCVPRRKLAVLTRAGQNSFSIYLWHPIFLFNIVTIVAMGKLLNHVTSTKAPPYDGLPAFFIITTMAVLFFFVLSLNLWRCVCAVCLAPPVVKCLFATRTDKRRMVAENAGSGEQQANNFGPLGDETGDRKRPLLLPVVVNGGGELT